MTRVAPLILIVKVGVLALSIPPNMIFMVTEVCL